MFIIRIVNADLTWRVDLATVLHTPHWSQECIPAGCIPSAAVAVCWGGRGPAQVGVLPREGSCPGEVCPGGSLPDTLPVNRMTDRHLWKHYLAATTLRKVINHIKDTIRVRSHLTTTTQNFDVVRDILHSYQYNCLHMTTEKTHCCRQVWNDL